jgi:hypothetical protein
MRPKPIHQTPEPDQSQVIPCCCSSEQPNWHFLTREGSPSCLKHFLLRTSPAKASREVLSHIQSSPFFTNEISAVSVKAAFAFAHNASSSSAQRNINSNHVRHSGSSSRLSPYRIPVEPLQAVPGRLTPSIAGISTPECCVALRPDRRPEDRRWDCHPPSTKAGYFHRHVDCSWIACCEGCA